MTDPHWTAGEPPPHTTYAPRIVQIAVTGDPEMGDTVYALTDDGTVYSLWLDNSMELQRQTWIKLPLLPSPTGEPTS